MKNLECKGKTIYFSLLNFLSGVLVNFNSGRARDVAGGVCPPALPKLTSAICSPIPQVFLANVYRGHDILCSMIEHIVDPSCFTSTLRLLLRVLPLLITPATLSRSSPIHFFWSWRFCYAYPFTPDSPLQRRWDVRYERQLLCCALPTFHSPPKKEYLIPGDSLLWRAKYEDGDKTENLDRHKETEDRGKQGNQALDEHG